MSLDHLIHTYLDEGLPETDEKMLFDELALSNELRNEFNNQMKLHLIAGKDIQTIAPPADLTNELFGKLGFASPNAPRYLPNETKPRWSAKYLLLLLLLLFPIGYFTSEFIGNKNQSITRQLTDSKANSINNQQHIPIVGSFETNIEDERIARNSIIAQSAESKNFVRSSLSKNKTFKETATKEGKNYLTDNGSHNSNLDKNLAVDTDILKNAHALPSDNLIHNVSITYDNPDTGRLLTDNNGNKFRTERNHGRFGKNSFENFSLPQFFIDEYNLELFRSSYFSDSKFEKLSDTRNPIANMTINAIYNYTENSSFGIEFAYDNYNQEFVRTIDNQAILQLQSPYLLSISPFYRLKLPVSNRLSLYSQANIGATSIGPLFKLNLGADFRIANTVKAKIGISSAALIYNVDNTLYTTDKFGIYYGFSYGF